MSDSATTLGTKIQEFVTDVTTLDVLTLTGDITLVTDSAYDEAAKKFNWDTMFKGIAEKLKTAAASELEVVAYTHAEWDLDSVNFVKRDLNAAQSNLVAAHNAAVESAQKSRFEAVKIIAGLVGANIP